MAGDVPVDLLKIRGLRLVKGDRGARGSQGPSGAKGMFGPSKELMVTGLMDAQSKENSLYFSLNLQSLAYKDQDGNIWKLKMSLASK